LVEEVALPSFRDTLYDGISDHTLGVAAALAAAAHGAQVLEKHFTISYSWQRSNEKAHLGAMTLEDLRLIKTVAADFGRMRLPG
jgi:sialic acid synthase SpsE